MSVFRSGRWFAGCATEELLNGPQCDRPKIATRQLEQACGLQSSAQLQGGQTVYQSSGRDGRHRDALD